MANNAKELGQEGLPITPEKAILNEYLHEMEKNGGKSKDVVKNYKKLLSRSRNRSDYVDWFKLWEYSCWDKGIKIQVDEEIANFMAQQRLINREKRTTDVLKYKEEYDKLWEEIDGHIKRAFDGQQGFDTMATVWIRIQRLAELTYRDALGLNGKMFCSILWNVMKQQYNFPIPPFDPNFHGLSDFDPKITEKDGKFQLVGDKSKFEELFNNAKDKNGNLLANIPPLKDGLKCGVGAWFYAKGWYMDPDTGSLEARADFKGPRVTDAKKLTEQLRSEINHFLTNAAGMSTGESFTKGKENLKSQSEKKPEESTEKSDSTPEPTASSTSATP